jgi:hypothetical protein
MRRPQTWMTLVTLIFGGAALVRAAGAADQGQTTHTTAEVVAIDTINRTLVIRNARGVEEKVQLDDNMAGFGDTRVGDRVILTLRKGPGWSRVTSVVKSSPSPSPPAKVGEAPRAAAAAREALAARAVLDAKVASLAGQADGVDRLWSEFKRACGFEEVQVDPREGIRGWFVIWEGSIRADLSGGFCRDLFNQVVDAGEPIKAGMAAAEDVARHTLDPGEIREIRLRHRMAWDGWALAAPKRLEK